MAYASLPISLTLTNEAVEMSVFEYLNPFASFMKLTLKAFVLVSVAFM